MLTKRRLIVSHLSAALVVTSVGLIPTVALGQDTLEEVVVTARKREESLQETPVAVSAFTGQSLEELGLTNISDLTRAVPNVDMYSGNGTTGNGNVYIRGIGARNTGVNFDSGVGIYVDGVYVSRADGAVLDNVDVQSVQVLRGPQGTLFGKNTTGGAILYTTNRPDEEYGGHAQVRVGNYNQLDSKVTVNVPLVAETLLSRFSLYQTKQDGYVQSEIPDDLPPQAAGNMPFIEDEFNDTDRWGGQGQLRWLAADDLILDLNYNYGKTDQKARGQNCQVVPGIEGTGWQANLQDANIVKPSTGLNIADWCQINENLGKDKIMANMDPNRYRAEVNTLALTADWEISDALNLKSITAGRNTVGGEVNELDAMGIALLGRTNYEGLGANGAEERDTDALSQEFQLIGNAFDEKLDYVVGVFGFREETTKGAAASPTLFFDVLPTLPESVLGPFANRAFYLSNLTELLTKNTSASAFSQADWHFDEYWTLTVGARYTWEERRLTRDYKVPDLATLSTEGDAYFLLGPTQTLYGFPNGPETFNPNHLYVYQTVGEGPDPLGRQTMHTDDSKVTPMASIQRTFDSMGFMDFGNAYFTVANGFLSGGITDTVNIVNGQIEEFDPEEVWNYELGFKMDAWEQKLRLNTAVFYTDYKDRQLTTIRISPEGRISGALINAKSSYISGIEFEAVVLPVDNLQITANVTFNESDIEEYDDFQITATDRGNCGDPISVGGAGTVFQCPIDRSDENMPRLPDSVFYLAAMYTFDTEYGSVVPMLSWSYRTNLDNCFDASSCISGIYKVDQEDITARLTWNSPDMNWRVTAFGNNLNDERYVTGGTPLVDVTATAGTVYNQPRTYGIEAAYTW